MKYSIARRRMVEREVASRGVKNEMVLEAMRKVPRHLFVEEAFQAQAYTDLSLPIGEKQTISQPFIVGLMTEALCLKGSERVLEIGTGSGYQAAVLGTLVRQLYSLERIPSLARKARQVLDSIGLSNVHVRVTDGTLGWQEHAPFDAIIVTAGAPSIPEAYLEQLSIGGVLVIPVGDQGSQVLTRVTRRGEGLFDEEQLVDCRFVPLVGRHGWQEGR